MNLPYKPGGLLLTDSSSFTRSHDKVQLCAVGGQFSKSVCHIDMLSNLGRHCYNWHAAKRPWISWLFDSCGLVVVNRNLFEAVERHRAEILARGIRFFTERYTL